MQLHKIRLKELIICKLKKAKNAIKIKLDLIFFSLFISAINWLALLLFCEFAGCNWLDNKSSH